MFDFNTLAEFSRAYCVGICALMIPANLVATSLTIIFTVLCRPAVHVCLAAGLASIFAKRDDPARIYLVHDWGGHGDHVHFIVAGIQLSCRQFRSDSPTQTHSERLEVQYSSPVVLNK